MASTRKSSRVRAAPGASPAKRKRPESPSFPVPAPVALFTAVEKDVAATVETVANQEPLAAPGGNTEVMAEDTPVEKVSAAIFKDPNFIHSSIGAAGSKRTRVWKNLKQIVATERSLPWQHLDVTYSLIEAPPSFKPARKYSDLSGLMAKYTDPQTKIRFADADEFSRVRMLPSDLVTGYLALRKASAPVP